jgi:predicted DsbA family dithiol-disulfide isomerase
MPKLETDTNIDIYQLLARKGYDRQSVIGAHDELKRKGLEQGFVFDFENIVVANTFTAHRLMHFAREDGKQDLAHEILFRAYFSEGKNLDDHATLIALGEEIGLDTVELSKVLRTNAYADVVRADMEEAQELGIEAVPHFMFNREHEVVGAEGSALLLQMLQNAHEEWRAANSRVNSD